MIIRVFLSICFFFGSIILYAQPEIDSLMQVMKAFQSKPNYQSDSNYLDLRNTIAFRYWSSKPDTLVSLSQENIALCHEAKYFKGEVDALKNIGVAYWVKGDYELALDSYHRALALAEKINYKKGRGRLYLNISLIYSDQGKYADALENNFKSLKICEAIADTKGLALNYNNMAIIYYNQNNFEEAISNYQESLKISQQSGNFQDMAMAMSNIAELYIRQQKYAEALDYYQRSMVLKEKVNDMVGLATNLGGIGEIYKLQGRYSEALNYYLRSLKIQESIGNKPDMAVLLQGIGSCYFELHESEKALDYCTRGLAIAKSIGHKKFIRDGSEILSKIYKAQKQFNVALKYYEDFKLYSDSINNQESEKRTAVLQAQYQFERKEIELKAEQEKKDIAHDEQSARQRAWTYLFATALFFSVLVTVILIRTNRVKQKVNHLLQLKNEEISLQKERLEAADIFKNKILSVVTHDIRGPLNSIKGMFYLIEEKAISAEESLGMISQVNVRINQVSGFVDDLLMWAKNQMVKPEVKYQSLQLEKLISETLNVLAPQAENKGVAFNVEADRSAKIVADEDMIKVVLRNLVSNGIKFCKKGDSIAVSFTDEGNECVRIVVADTGQGIDSEKMKKLFLSPDVSTTGTNNEPGTGLGLILCKQYIELNGGEIGVNSEPGLGSQFWFTVPKLV
jgi:two-component system, sensor histidine kinase and response regulator